MKTVLFLAVVAVACFSAVQSKDFILGNTYNSRVVSSQKVEAIGVPFMITTRKTSYKGPPNQIIKAVVARDLKGSGAEVFVKSGGVGFTYVTIKINSKRGKGLDYVVDVYA